MSSLLADPKMSKLIREIAKEQDASTELDAVLDVSNSMGTVEPIWMLRRSQIEALPTDACEALAQLHHSRLASLGAVERAAADVREESARAKMLMQRAYNSASERLQHEVLPLVYQSDVYSSWAKQQLHKETRDAQWLALVQSKPVCAAFGAELNVTAPDAAPAFLAAVLIEGLLLAPPGDARAALGRRLVDCHLIESDAAGLSTNAKAELLGLLEPRVLVQPDVERESLDRAAALKGLLKELRAALQAPLERFLSSAVYGEVASAVADQQLDSNGFVHFMYCAAGFEPLRVFLSEQRANENLDFFKQVLAFKRIEDLFATKHAAGMIADKFLSDGAPSQVALPAAILAEIESALLPKFPHPKIFDAAVDNVLDNLRQEAWPQFKMSSAFRATAAAVRVSLRATESITNPKVLLAVRQGNARRCIIVAKKVVVVGKSTESDLVIRDTPETTIMIESCPAEKGGGFKVALLWSKMTSGSAVAQEHAAKRAAFESCMGMTVVSHGQHVCSGETFHIGSLEAVLFSIEA